MSTYIISDIHGYKDRFFKLLESINFDWNNDNLYILGDIIDRGPQSAEMLIWAVDEAPDNVHFLIGNHEDMAYAVLKHDVNAYTEDSPHPYPRSWGAGWVNEFDPWNEPWYHNGGPETMTQLCARTTEEWRRGPLLDWLNSLENYFIVDDWLLVHAGLGFGSVRLHDDIYDMGRQEWISIPGLENKEFSQHLYWIRYSWLFNKNQLPYNVAFGHTPTSINWMRDLSEYYEYDKNNTVVVGGNPGQIVVMRGYGNDKCRVCLDTGRGIMGIMRLDDMRKFYGV